MNQKILSDMMINEINELIDEKINEKNELSKNDMKEIIQSIIPNIDQKISEIVKKHLLILLFNMRNSLKFEE